MKGKRLVLLLALFGGAEEQCNGYQPRECFLDHQLTASGSTEPNVLLYDAEQPKSSKMSYGSHKKTQTNPEPGAVRRFFRSLFRSK